MREKPWRLLFFVTPNPSTYVAPMSTTPISISGSDFDANDPDSRARLQCVVTHVFLPFPPKARYGQYTTSMDGYLVIRPVCAAARAYSEVIDDALKPQWHCIIKMLDYLEAFIFPGDLGIECDSDVFSQLCGMQTGGMLLISPQTLC